MPSRSGCAIWCCSAFLSSTAEDEDAALDYYSLLKIERNATPDQVKKAYKKQSLLMHPDKLAQRGKVLTPGEQADFVRMKEGYDVLSSPKDRALYDSLGEKGYKWSQNPMSIDREELFRNFCNSAICDRFKIFSILLIFFAILLTPLVLFCIRIDNHLSNAPFTLILIPLWVIDFIFLIVHLMSISLPAATPPDDDDGSWVDPFPRADRVKGALSFLCVAAIEILAALRVDNYVAIDYALVFIPYYVWEILRLYKTVPVAFMSIISVEEVEHMMEKSYMEVTQEERELLQKQYSVLLPSTHPDYTAAVNASNAAKTSLLWIVMRINLVVFIVLHLDDVIEWSWWLVFLPFWILACLCCCVSCQGVFSTSGDIVDAEIGNPNYGATDDASHSKLSPEEKELRRAELTDKAQRSLSMCCSTFFGAGFVALAVGKFAGATYSSLWIIFPLLLFVGILLCCAAYCIFGANQSVYEESLNQNKPNAPPPPSDEEPLVGVTAPCTAEDLAELKVKELKSLARQWGVNTADCFERTDIVNKLVSFDPEAGLPAMVVEEPKVEVKAAVVKEEDVGVRISADSDDLD